MVPLLLIAVLISFIDKKRCTRRRRQAVKVEIYFDDNKGLLMGSKILKVGEGVGASVVFKDKNGKVAPIDGKPVWAFDQPAVADMSVSDDGLSAFFMAKDVGQGKVQISADADLGEGVVTIIGEADLIVAAEQAEVVEISFGDVRPA